jgi:sigma-E factor negative regulatory protein RseC
MIEARAVVLRVEAGRAWVKVTDRQDGCGRCDEPGGCRSVKIAYALKAPTEVFSVPDSIGAQPGERVRVRMNDGAPLAGAMASYGLGAVLLLAGAAAGHFAAPAGGEDFSALLGGIVGLAFAFVVNRLLYRSRRWRGALRLDLARDDGSCTLDAGSPS